jgi:D-alanyl-D-alanine carboxypeptidase
MRRPLSQMLSAPVLLLTSMLALHPADSRAIAHEGVAGGAAANLGDHEAEALRAAVAAKLAQMREQWAHDREHVDSRGFPGITFAFCLPDGRCDATAVGYSDVTHQIPMRSDDRMLAGSIGKTFVAAVIMQLTEEGRLHLDDRMAVFLGREPWFPRLANSNEITVRMLLAHRTGIGGTGNVIGPAGRAFHANPERVWSHIDRLPLDLPAKFPAGSDFEYRDENYDLAALVIEKVTGDSYYTELSRRILLPLQLAGTYPQNNRSARHLPGVVNGYQRRDDSLALGTDISTNGTFVISPSYEWGGGGLVSNSPDLARWARALYGGRLFKDTTTAEILRSVGPYKDWGSTVVSTTEQYSLGASVYKTPYGRAFGHEGFLNGYRSAMMYYEKYDLSVALQTNTDYVIVNGKARAMDEELHDALQQLAQIIVTQHLQW